MRTITLALAGVGVTLGLAACTTGGAAGTTTPSASAGTAATGGTASGGSPARSCVVGDWRGTGMNATFDAGGPTGSASGGAGLELKVSPDGRTVIDFSRMQPVNVQADAGGTQFKGQFTYGGTVTGTVQVSDPAASSGTWKPVGPTDWGNLVVSVDITSPIQTKIQNVKVSDFANSGNGQLGGSVETQPILREASYSCSGDGLTISPPPGSTVGGTWLLTRG